MPSVEDLAPRKAFQYSTRARYLCIESCRTRTMETCFYTMYVKLLFLVELQDEGTGLLCFIFQPMRPFHVPGIPATFPTRSCSLNISPSLPRFTLAVFIVMQIEPLPCTIDTHGNQATIDLSLLNFPHGNQDTTSYSRCDVQ